MKNLKLKALVALLILTAILVSPGWIKDISGEEESKPVQTESVQLDSNIAVSGVSLENSNAGIYSLKLATNSYAQFY